MKYRCIVCKVTWGQGFPETEGYSDGLCKEHQMILLVKLYRERQTKERNHDCCGRSNGHCDRDDCAFRHVCLAPERPPAEVIDFAISELSAKAVAKRAEEEKLRRELYGEDTLASYAVH